MSTLSMLHVSLSLFLLQVNCVARELAEVLGMCLC